jgi:hypothetical protein
MRALGFYCVSCGKDGPDAWVIAQQWNERWQAVRRGDAPSPANALCSAKRKVPSPTSA